MKRLNLSDLFARAEWIPLLGVTVLSVITLSFIAPAFLSEYNLFVMLRILSVTSIVAMAQMIVIGVGQMNLAVGAIGGLVAILFGGLMEVYGLPVPLAALIGFTAGLLAGWINGALTAYTGINGFIITLATLSVYTGLNYGITESIPFYNMPPSLIAWYDGHVGFLPNIVFIPLVMAFLVAVFLFRHPWGRYILAVGGNPAAAELSGLSVPQERHSGAFRYPAPWPLWPGIVSVARLGTAEPTIGTDWLLASFARAGTLAGLFWPAGTFRWSEP